MCSSGNFLDFTFSLVKDYLPLWEQHQHVTEGQYKSLADYEVPSHGGKLHPPAESEAPAARWSEPQLWSGKTKQKKVRLVVRHKTEKIIQQQLISDRKSGLLWNFFHLLLLFVMSCFSGQPLGLQGCSWHLSLQAGHSVRQNCFLCLLQRKSLERKEKNLVNKEVELTVDRLWLHCLYGFVFVLLFIQVIISLKKNSGMHQLHPDQTCCFSVSACSRVWSLSCWRVLSSSCSSSLSLCALCSWSSNSCLSFFRAPSCSISRLCRRTSCGWSQ